MNVVTFIRRTLVSAAAIVGIGITPLASADPVLIATGFANGYQAFDLHVVSPALNLSGIHTGAFTGTLDLGTGPKPLTFFCFELTEYFSFGPNPLTPAYTDTIYNGSKKTLLDELFTEGYAHALDSTQNSVAFQLAVWEILEESTPLSVTATSGNFYVNGDANTITAANNLIAGLGPAAGYEIHLLHSVGSQDFIYVNLTPTLLKVPEPSSLLLMAIALAGMGFSMRRKGSNLA